MTRIAIRKLIWDDWNLEHIQKHKVSKFEVEEVGKGPTAHKQANQNRYRVIGRSGVRILVLIVVRKATTTYYLVTARDADKKERRLLYQKEKNNS